MAKESYIERLQRERKEILDYARSVRAWEDAVYLESVTGRKGSARKVVEEKKAQKDRLYQTIEPYLAD